MNARTTWGFLLLTVAACGGGRDGGDRGATASRATLPEFDACDLLPQDVAEGILGEAVTRGPQRLNQRSEQSGVAVSDCLYNGTESPRSVHVVVRYSAREAPPASYDALLQAARADTGSMGRMTTDLLEASRPVEGLGPVAYWTPGIRTLTAYTASHYLISATADPPRGGGDAAAYDQATEVVRKVIEHL